MPAEQALDYARYLAFVPTKTPPIRIANELLGLPHHRALMRDRAGRTFERTRLRAPPRIDLSRTGDRLVGLHLRDRILRRLPRRHDELAAMDSHGPQMSLPEGAATGHGEFRQLHRGRCPKNGRRRPARKVVCAVCPPPGTVRRLLAAHRSGVDDRPGDAATVERFARMSALRRAAPRKSLIVVAGVEVAHQTIVPGCARHIVRCPSQSGARH